MSQVQVVWKLCISFLLVTVTVLQVLAVLTPEWIEIQCQDGSMNIGLWQYCGEPVIRKNDNSDTENGTENALLNLFAWGQDSNFCISLDFPVNVLRKDPGNQYS